jgi:hypothetical protein
LTTDIANPEPTALIVGSLQMNWGMPDPHHTLGSPPEEIAPTGVVLCGRWTEPDLVFPDGKKKKKQHKRKDGSTRKVETRPRCMQDPMPVPGPRSAEPGPWLSEGIVDCLLDEEQKELIEAEQDHYARLRLVQESFIGVRHDGLHYIPEQSRSRFSFVGDGLLTEDEREELEQEMVNDSEIYEFEKPTPKPKAAAKSMSEATDAKIAAYTPTSNTKLNDAYSVWKADNSPHNHADLWSEVHNYVQGQLKYVPNKTKERGSGVASIEETASQFTITFMDSMGSAVIKEVPFNVYLATAWSNERKGYFKERNRYDDKYQQDGITVRGANGEDDATFSRLEEFSENAWNTGEYGIEGRSWIPGGHRARGSGRDADRTPQRYWIASSRMTQAEIGVVEGISQQAIEKRKEKGVQWLKERLAK